MGIRVLAVAAAFVPLTLCAQTKPTITSTTTVNLSLLKPVMQAEMTALSGTTLSSAPTYFNVGCSAGACTVAKGTATATGVTMPLGGSKVAATQVRASLLTPHGIDHTLFVSLNGAEILNAICSAAMELKLAPNFKSVGALNNGFTWELYEGGKLVKSGKSAGEALALNMGGQVNMASQYDFTVYNHGVIEILHGANQRIVLTPLDQANIGAKTGGSLRFEDLGLRVAGIDQFAIVAAGLK